MSRKADILARLYRAGKVTAAGLLAAVEDGVITEKEYQAIVGEVSADG